MASAATTRTTCCSTIAARASKRTGGPASTAAARTWGAGKATGARTATGGSVRGASAIAPARWTSWALPAARARTPTPPCGACRQILWEFGGNLEIQLANLVEEKGRHHLKNLLPLPFDARLL